MTPTKALYQISLKLILKNAEGKILTLKALDAERDILRGFFDLPGGRIHEDEDDQPLTEILKREVEEEIGPVQYSLKSMPVATSRWTYRFPKGGILRVFYLFFEGMYQSGEIATSREHQYPEWVNLATDDLEKRFPQSLVSGIRQYVESAKCKV